MSVSTSSECNENGLCVFILVFSTLLMLFLITSRVLVEVILPKPSKKEIKEKCIFALLQL